MSADNSKIVASKEYKWVFENITKDIFKAEKFSLSKDIKIFLAENETKWRIFVYFDEKNGVGTFIQKIKTDSDDLLLTFSVSITTNDCRGPSRCWFTKESSELTFGHGWNTLIKVDDLFDQYKNYLKNGKLSLEFKVELIQNDKMVNESESNMRKLLSRYEHLHNSKKFSDFTFICSDGKRIPVHRVIISSHSPVLKAMLETQMSESRTKTAKINDIDGDTMLEILRFMYSGSVNNIVKIVKRLLRGAEKYDMEELKDLCVSKIKEKLSVNNVIDNLILADQCNAKKLLIACIKFIKLNYSEVRQDYRWHLMSKELLSQVMDYIEQDSKCMSEFTTTF